MADITYVPLRGKRFAYLAMLMDRYSRRLIGWCLDDTMTENTAHAERELTEYFAYYNRERKQSSLGYQTPHQFESQTAGRK